MRKSIGAVVLISALFVAGGAAAQGMLLDYAADRVIKKYQTSTCDELKAQKGEPPSEKEKLAIDFLRDDAQARVAFIDKIARDRHEQDVRMRHVPVRWRERLRTAARR